MKKTNYKQYNLEEWLSYLENSHSTEIQLGLERISLVAKKLNLLNFSELKVITVAGTNGKGSTVAFLEALYTSAGYRVGAYTSPHLLTFNERIKVNQQCISDDILCKLFIQIEEARDTILLTYFEVVTLAALLYFKSQALHLIILEVGLGGRLDATNIIDADLAIITTIDFDHQAYLGNTIDAIALEKAGIIKFAKPIIYADRNPSISIINRASQLHSPLYCLGKDYSYNLDKQVFDFQSNDKKILINNPKLHVNAIAAGCMASLLLKDHLKVNDEIIVKTAENTTLSARLELIKNRRPNLLLDVSHNPQSVRRLAEFVLDLNLKTKVHAVFSALKDKDLEGLVKPMLPMVQHWYVAPLEIKRTASIEEIKAAFQADSAIPYCFENIGQALDEALKNAEPDELIIVYGSFFTVAKVKEILAARVESYI